MAVKYECDACGREFLPGDVVVFVLVRARGNDKEILPEHLDLECVQAVPSIMSTIKAHIVAERYVDVSVKRMGQNGRWIG